MVCASLVLSFGQLQPPVFEPYEALFCPDSSHITPWAGYARELGRFFGWGDTQRQRKYTGYVPRGF